MKRLFLTLFIFLLIGGFCLSSGVQSAFAVSEKEKYGGILVRNHPGMPDQFGYPQTMHGVNAMYISFVAEPLILPSHLNPGGHDPVLATGWEIAPDKMSYTFFIRKGVKFHDGTDMNALIAKWNMDKLMDSPVPFLKKVKSVDAVDDYTLRFNLTEWDPFLVHDVSDTVARIVSPAAYEKNGEKWMETHPVGTGPWMFKEFKHKEYIRFKKNPNYWDKNAKLYLDEMHYLHLQDPMVIMAEMLQGNIHDNTCDIDFCVQFIGKEGFNTMTDYIPMHNAILQINATDPTSIWSDKRMRYALEYAINKEEICKALGYDVAEPRYEAIYPMGRIKGAKLSPNLRKYDPEKAKKLMAEAGYPNGVQVDAWMYPHAKTDLMYAAYNQLSEVGIKCNIRLSSDAAMREKTNERGPLPDEIIPATTMSNAFNPVAYASTILAPNSVYLQGLLRPAGFDNLITEASTKTNLQEALPMVNKAEQLAYDDAIVIPLWSKPSMNVNSKKVHDAIWFTFGQSKSNLNNAWIEK